MATLILKNAMTLVIIFIILQITTSFEIFYSSVSSTRTSRPIPAGRRHIPNFTSSPYSSHPPFPLNLQFVHEGWEIRRQILQPFVRLGSSSHQWNAYAQLSSKRRATTERHQWSSTNAPTDFVAYPFQYNEILTLEVETLTNMGIGICRTRLEQRPKDMYSQALSRGSEKNESQSECHEEISSYKSKNNKLKGWVIMIPNVIPGEKILAQIYRNNKRYSDAHLLEVLTPSPHRTEPKCPLSTICGGCQYQHMDVVSQRLFKTSQVQELFERIGGLHPESFPRTQDIVGTDEIYNYRTKITPTVLVASTGSVMRSEPKNRKNRKNRKNARSKRTEDDDLHNGNDMQIRAIGFKKKTNREVVDVPYCYIATEAINAELALLREKNFKALRGSWSKLERSTKKKRKQGEGDEMTMLFRDAYEERTAQSVSGRSESGEGEGKCDENYIKPLVETDPNVYVMAHVKGLTFRFMAGNFFQNNPFMLPVMVDHVVEAAMQPNELGIRMTHLIDCYCGSGLFCLSSAAHFDVCVGIEVNKRAVEEARINAALNDITNCKFVAASAEAIFESREQVMAIESLTMMNDDANQGSVTPKTTTISFQVEDFPRNTTTVIIDPPRKGCSPEFLKQLYTFGPQKIVYMSCDPATQARDSKGIISAGYRIVAIQPFDLFPQTRHIENLVTFVKVR